MKIFKCIILAVLAVFSQFSILHADTVATGKVLGSPQGTFSVSPTGGAVYSVSIDVPSGRLDMQPNIALTYNSQAGYGIAGYGVSLTGVSAITRGCKDLFHDGFTKGVNVSEFNVYEKEAYENKYLW